MKIKYKTFINTGNDSDIDCKKCILFDLPDDICDSTFFMVNNRNRYVGCFISKHNYKELKNENKI